MSSQTTGQLKFHKAALRAELERTGKRPVNVASDLLLAPRTVERWVSDASPIFPSGTNVRRLEAYFGRRHGFFAHEPDPAPLGEAA